MAAVTYNNVTLPYANLTNFNQESVYDDSGTDRIYTKITLNVQCLINANYLNLLNNNLITIQGDAPTQEDTDNAAEVMKAIRQLLLQQRRTLSVTFNGQELIPGPQITLQGEVDAKNGPQPQYCNITQLTNVSFLLSWGVVAHYWESPRTDASGENIIFPNTINDLGNFIVTNRWEEVADIDNCNYTTYTRRGKYVIRSDNFQGLIADDLREQLAVLAPYVGFLREYSRYTVSKDGLAIEYEIRDREQFKLPPGSGGIAAYQADGDYTESASIAGLALRSGTCRVRLKGDLFTSQSALLDLAIDICVRKCNSRGFIENRSGITMAAEAKQDLYNNIVSFSLTVVYKVNIDGARAKGVAAFKGLKTTTPSSDGLLRSPTYLPYGSAIVKLHAARYFDPSLLDVALDINGQLDSGLEPGQAGATPEV